MDIKTLNRRQKVGLVGILVVVLIIVGVIMWATRTDNQIAAFELDVATFAESGVKELTAAEYEEKLAAEESFLVLAHGVACPAGMPLTDLTRELAKEKQMTIYALKQEEFKGSSLAVKIKYLPSMAVVHKGRVVKFLDAESNDDLPAYQSLEGLEKWLSQYVIL